MRISGGEYGSPRGAAKLDPVETEPRQRVRTYPPQRSRLTQRRRDALSRLWPRFGVGIDICGKELDLSEVFGRSAPVVLEIGFGMGEATVAMAAADPQRNYLAVDVNLAGVADLLDLLDREALANVRVARGDALDLVGHQLGEQSLAAIHVFFPDPWRKARHRERRLVQPEHVRTLSSRLRPGGHLHCATDSVEYATSMLATLTAEDSLTNVYERFAPRHEQRPLTKFEQRGLAAGRPVFDLAFLRTPVVSDVVMAALPRP
jgi:tRNA (guanine-N7-)-methyltransferase